MSLLHSQSTSIHKGAYIQTSDPGAVGAKILWVDITSSPYVIKRRNDTDTGWDVLGYLPAVSGVADGSLFIKKDGSVAFTGDQSMGSHKLTNVTDPSSNQDAATKKYVDDTVAGGSGAPTNATYITQTPSAGLSNEQAMSLLSTGLVKNTTTTGQQSIADVNDLSAPVYAADGGSTDAYAITLSPAPVAYQTGVLYRFKANTANTGACSLNVNGLGAKTIKKVAGGITTDLADNDIRVGQFVDVVYDGTNMQMQSTLGNAAGGGISGLTTGTIPKAGSSTSIVDGPLSVTGSIVQFPDNTWSLRFGGSGQGSISSDGTYLIVNTLALKLASSSAGLLISQAYVSQNAGVSGGINMGTNGGYAFVNSTNPETGSVDAAIRRNAAGKLEINNGQSSVLGSTSDLRDLLVRQHYVDQTITAGGTTGNQTINKAAGTVNIAASGTSVTVTNSLVSTSSLVFAVLRTNDSTATIKNVVPASGSFTINLGAAATAEVSIGFIVINK